mmetsp:Transcript_157702/g.483279  ORF Transcript_157702/g.483279 Transcript_157702/m.483279 type:complete len:285 (-) Transcript_157702:229-1083(-)
MDRGLLETEGGGAGAATRWLAQGQPAPASVPRRRLQPQDARPGHPRRHHAPLRLRRDVACVPRRPVDLVGPVARAPAPHGRRRLRLPGQEQGQRGLHPHQPPDPAALVPRAAAALAARRHAGAGLGGRGGAQGHGVARRQPHLAAAAAGAGLLLLSRPRRAAHLRVHPQGAHPAAEPGAFQCHRPQRQHGASHRASRDAGKEFRRLPQYHRQPGDRGRRSRDVPPGDADELRPRPGAVRSGVGEVCFGHSRRRPRGPRWANDTGVPPLEGDRGALREADAHGLA